MIKGCIFDLDGTLIDTLYDLGNSTNIVLERHGYQTHALSEYKLFVGNGVYKLVERALPANSKDIEQCYKEFQDEYRKHFLDHSDPYDGILEMLEKLEEMHIAVSIVTNKPHDYATRLVEKRIHTRVECIYGEQMNIYPKKPDPTSVQLALNDLSLKEDEVFYIGDSNVDIQTAKNANVKSIGVLWGFRSKEELEKEGATYIATTPQDIIKIIEKENEE